jgi:outer membrane protein assembly factor BamB
LAAQRLDLASKRCGFGVHLRSKDYKPTLLPVTQCCRGHTLYLAGGYVGDTLKPNKPVYAVRPGGQGDLTLPEGETKSQFIAWMEPNAAPYNPSPLVYDGRFYVLWDFGFLSCRDAKTGREIYDKQRIKPDGSAGFTASPWAYRGRLFCLSEDGDTYVFQAGDTYKLERVNSLGEMCMATPAMARDSLFLRSISAVYRIQENGAAGNPKSEFRDPK